MMTRYTMRRRCTSLCWNSLVTEKKTSLASDWQGQEGGGRRGGRSGLHIRGRVAGMVAGRAAAAEMAGQQQQGAQRLPSPHLGEALSLGEQVQQLGDDLRGCGSS